MNLFSRREALALGAATVIGTRALRPAGGDGSEPPEAPGNPFALGVSSGDPAGGSVVLWTRLVAPDGGAFDTADVDVEWELAPDVEFCIIANSGTATARTADGHSVHVVAPLAAPRYFRFRVGEWTSPVGRTSPAGQGVSGLTESRGTVDDATPTLLIAAANCQHFESGFYAAHRDIAEWRPDLVLFLGDFIYEGASEPVGGENVRSHQGPEIRTLDDYRNRYAQYLSDADLQASRAICPWLSIWDDHEADNNYAGLTPEDASDAPDFATRRLAAYQAWWEHMPVRMARPESTDDLTIYRTVTWGSLAKLILLDGRQYRSDQACGDVTMSLDPPCDEALDPDRTMLGAEQEQWLIGELADVAPVWAVIGQQTVMTDMRVPGSGAIINYDQWDGYAPARDRLLLAAAQTDRTVVLTGDIHLAGVGVLPGIGVEFVTTSISSGGIDPSLADGLTTLFPNIVGAELAHRGYTRHTVTAETWTAEYRIVDDVAVAASAVSTWRSFAVDAGARDSVVEV